MKTQFNQPQGSTSRETNKEAIARIFGLKKSQVAYINSSTPVDPYTIIFDKESQTCWYTDGATGTPIIWNIADNMLTLSTTVGVFYLKQALSIKSDNILLEPKGRLSNALYYITLDQFLDGSDDEGFYDNAIDAATAYAVANGYPKIKMFSKPHKIKREHIIPSQIEFEGSRSGKYQQGSGTGLQAGATPAERAANPSDSAFLWYGEPGAKIWFACGQLCTFNGIVFGAPLQNWSATNKADIIDYGTTITSTSCLNVINCVYYGMTNFVNATGSSHFYAQNYGFCMQKDFQITGSRDVNRIQSCHANPNVIRPDPAMWRCLVDDNRVFLTLTNHDGSHVFDCHTFCHKRAVVNKNSNSYLGILTLYMGLFDQTGCVLDNDTAGDSVITLSGVKCIGDNASNAGVTTADTDSGYIILRKSTNTLISKVFMSNCDFQPSSSPVTSKPPYLINFQTSSGYIIDTKSVHCPEVSDNGVGTSCIMTGSIINSTRYYESTPILENMVPNPAWAYRHPTNSVPRGWTFTNCSVNANAGRTVTATADNASFGTSFRQYASTRTYIFTARSVGTSSGVTVTATAQNGTVTTYTGSWVKRGQKYYCVISATTDDLYHAISINVGDSGATIGFEYAAMVSGNQLTYSNSYSERLPKPTSMGVAAYSVQLAAGGSHSLYPDQAGLAGAYHLYISSVIGTMVCRLVKLTPTSVPTITVEDSIYAAANTFTVSWPSNSTPTIVTSDSGLLFITVTGASYSVTY